MTLCCHHSDSLSALWLQEAPGKEAPHLSGAPSILHQNWACLPAAPRASGQDSRGRCQRDRVPGRRR